MAIEWLDNGNTKLETNDRSPLLKQDRSVLELIRLLANRFAGHQMLVEDGLVHVTSLSTFDHEFNFLNLPIEYFAVTHECLYGTQADLRTAIDMTLHPERYRGGWGGGYGGVSIHDPDGLFWIRNISFSMENTTIREILNQIARKNGNALWVVKLEPEEFNRPEAYWKGKSSKAEGLPPISSRIEFVPLANLATLATEQLTVDLSIDGFVAAQRYIFPVMMEHGVGHKSNGTTGIGSEAGSCTYSISLIDVRPNEVILDVSINVKPLGRPATNLNEQIKVDRDGVSRRVVGPIDIKAVLGPRKKDQD
jgi:hypothetical protein